MFKSAGIKIIAPIEEVNITKATNKPTFIKGTKLENIRTAKPNPTDDALKIMQDLFKAKQMLSSNINSKLVTDHILGSIRS